MKNVSILTLALVFAVGCGGSKTAETEAAAPEPAAEPAPPPPPEPTEEEKKAAEEKKKLEEDRAKMQARAEG